MQNSKMQVLMTELSDVMIALNAVTTKIQSHASGTLPLFNGSSHLDKVIEKYSAKDSPPPGGSTVKRVKPSPVKKTPEREEVSVTIDSDDDSDDDDDSQYSAEPKKSTAPSTKAKPTAATAKTSAAKGGVVKRGVGRPKKLSFDVEDQSEIIAQINALQRKLSPKK